jgi:hypothetical protein
MKSLVLILLTTFMIGCTSSPLPKSEQVQGIVINSYGTVESNWGDMGDMTHVAFRTAQGDLKTFKFCGAHDEILYGENLTVHYTPNNDIICDQINEVHLNQ